MKTTTMVALLALGTFTLTANAYPGAWESLFLTNNPNVKPPFKSSEVTWLFPHQVAVGDLICTGTVLSTNKGWSAEFAVDEILWGYVASSNITIRRVDRLPLEEFHIDERYLVVAFTNNWWGDLRDHAFIRNSTRYLYDFISPTSRPPDQAVFDDHRICIPRDGVISFDYIVENGTNYWEGTRTFITNFLEIAKFQQDERKAYEWLYNLSHANTNFYRRLPRKIRSELYVYMWMRYYNFKLPPPNELPK